MSEILPITLYGNPILRKKAKKVESIDESFISLIESMFITMHQANGIGLAAPQINKDLSLAIIDVSDIDKYKKQKPIVMINPQIIEAEGESVKEEGCLSIPGIHLEIARPAKVLIRYKDLNMKDIDIELEDLPCRVAQHEIDHLNGILFIDKVSAEEKNRIKKDLKNIKKGKIEVDYLLL